MSTRKIEKWLSEEDLERTRDAAYAARFADSGNPACSRVQALGAYKQEAELERGLRDRYDLDPETSYYFSLVDGAIAESEDPS